MYDQFRASLITQTRLINLRWISVVAMTVVALVSPGILGSTELMPTLLAVAGSFALLNAGLHLAAFWNSGRESQHGVLSSFVQLCIDLLAWGAYIYFSGGTTNPLISVLLPLVAIGAIVLNQAQAWVLGGAAILIYSLLSQNYEPLHITDVELATHLHLVGMWFVFVVSAIVLLWFVLQLTRSLRERDAALAEAREQAIRNDWLISIGSLAAEAAHELSTPLATMNVLVGELLADPTHSSSTVDDLVLMHRQIDACKEALRQITRSAKTRDREPSRIAISLWLKGMLNGWLGLNPHANVSCKIAHGLQACGSVFDVSIERAIANLLDNALKANASSIELDASVDEGTVVIGITDNGNGMPEAALEAFKSGVPIESSSGMGIGLFLARVALERHGGSLELVRAVPVGTKACIRIPAQDLKEVKHAT